MILVSNFMQGNSIKYLKYCLPRTIAIPQDATSTHACVHESGPPEFQRTRLQEHLLQISLARLKLQCRLRIKVDSKKVGLWNVGGFVRVLLLSLVWGWRTAMFQLSGYYRKIFFCRFPSFGFRENCQPCLRHELLKYQAALGSKDELSYPPPTLGTQ